MSTNWEADAARLSVFVANAIPLASIDVATGASATQRIDRPADKLMIEIGTYRNYAVTLNKTPQRVDLQLGPVPRMGGGPSVATIGAPADTLKDLLALWGKFSQPVDALRLAIGLTIGQVAASQNDAVDILFSHLNWPPRGTQRVEDFLLQLNRPRTSITHATVTINRLVKWQPAQVHVMMVLAAGATGTVMSQPTIFQRAQVEIDVNTSPAASLIPSATMTALLDEMKNLAEEIVVKGNVP
jgi:hypothetical protein